MNEVIGCVITNEKENSNEYYSIDHTSGGYPYWSKHIKNAKIFKTQDIAIEIIENDSDFNKQSIMSSGEKFPPIMIHKASGVCNNKQKGNAYISVLPLMIGCSENGLNNDVFYKVFNAEIVRPKGFTY